MTLRADQRKLFDKWHKQAYKGCPKPTKEETASRTTEFLAMAKKCNCGAWHLEFEPECKKCQKPALARKTKT